MKRSCLLATAYAFLQLSSAPNAHAASIGGVDLGGLTDYLFFFADGSTDANWQGASKGFVGDVAVDGIQASERTSGTVPYSGTIYTNDSTLGAWQKIVTDNPATATGITGDTGRISSLESDLGNAFSQIDGLSASSGFNGVSATSLDGLNTQNGTGETFVIDITSGLNVSSAINITGDANDAFILRWDENVAMGGYQGQVKFQSGGGINPLGGLTPINFVNVAGDINASGGGSNLSGLQTYLDQIDAFSGETVDGGGFFTGYWLTTGDPDSGETAPFSNAIFVGGWYSSTTKFSMTSGTSGVHVIPVPAALWLFGSGLLGLVGIARRHKAS